MRSGTEDRNQRSSSVSERNSVRTSASSVRSKYTQSAAKPTCRWQQRSPTRCGRATQSPAVGAPSRSGDDRAARAARETEVVHTAALAQHSATVAMSACVRVWVCVHAGAGRYGHLKAALIALKGRDDVAC